MLKVYKTIVIRDHTYNIEPSIFAYEIIHLNPFYTLYVGDRLIKTKVTITSCYAVDYDECKHWFE